MVWPDWFHTHIRPHKLFSCHNGFISILFVGADSSLKNSSGLTAQQMALTSDMKKTIKGCEKKVCVDIPILYKCTFLWAPLFMHHIVSLSLKSRPYRYQKIKNPWFVCETKTHVVLRMRIHEKWRLAIMLGKNSLWILPTTSEGRSH